MLAKSANEIPKSRGSVECFDFHRWHLDSSLGVGRSRAVAAGPPNYAGRGILSLDPCLGSPQWKASLQAAKQ